MPCLLNSNSSEKVQFLDIDIETHSLISAPKVSYVEALVCSAFNAVFLLIKRFVRKTIILHTTLRVITHTVSLQ